jgi:two-component system NtrC family sensor kinase
MRLLLGAPRPTALTGLFHRLSLSAKLISSYLLVLGVGGLAIIAVGSYIVSSAIMAEARRTVKHDLAIARAVYRQELDLMGRTLEVTGAGRTIPGLLAEGDTAGLLGYLRRVRDGARLDFLSLATPDGRVLLRTSSDARSDDVGGIGVVADVLRGGGASAGAQVVPADRLEREGPGLAARARVPLEASARAFPLRDSVVTDGLVLMGAAPVHDAGGGLAAVVYGGRLLNADFDIVDRVWNELYHDEATHDDSGTVTIFLGDVRVSTNVRTGSGARALGTRVSPEVREAVLERGESWNGRAFVVDEWSITAYEPVRDPTGRIIGMLYVGLPEASYVATRNRVIVSFVLIAGVGFLLVIGVTYLGIERMTRPLGQMVEATKRIAAGDFGRPVEVDPGSEGEFARLAGSFNLMRHSLQEMRRDLEEWGRTLEEKVQERTEELVRMQSRVAQSERLASIGMLAAGVAHEINNPLGGILALTALTLEDLPRDDGNRENLEEVVRQTERCRDIVRHLLEFSRQTDVSIEETDLNEVVERTLGLLRRQSLFFNVEIVNDLDPELPHVLADASQLQQVFMNILMNAVQAMDEKGTLTLVSLSLPSREEVEVRFVDTGCGIPPEHLGRIFDPFFTTGKGGQGTGLGLSIAYGIVAKHHGSITVESEVGLGTTFTVRLPTARRARATATLESAGAAAVPDGPWTPR